ncbi:phospholipase A [Psychrobacter sp. DM8]|uniref:phospholipase A n=1 Tax=Psychrobacter sp. DM8 TaxID=3440636 RepID=UPI003F50BE36
MLAHSSSSYLHTDSSEHHLMTSKRRLPTTLSVAITLALSGFTIQAYAQTYNELSVDDATVEYPSTRTSPVMDEVLGSSRAPAERKTFVANQTQLFLECQDLQVSAARLACYDKVASQGKTPTYTETKQPVDLAKTIKSTISGNPQVVLAKDNGVSKVSEDTAASTESLDTVGLTQREAEVLENIGVTQDDIEKYSPLSLAYDLDQNSERGTWTVRPYRPNYVLPLFYSFDPNLNPTSSNPDEPGEEYTSNDIRNTELKFQLSLKTKVGEDLFDTNADLWFGYTQQAHWQVYNEDNSRPFRGTDYQPEIFLTQPVTANLPFDGRLRMLGAGLVHHSNGRSDPISRSWNRAYLMAGAEWGKFSIVPRVWARINNESDSSEDNPDIEDFLGYGDIKFLYDLPKQQSLSGTLRYNPSTNKGAAQIDYIYPLSENVNGYVQLFQGYGESIIDYDYENTAIGFGIVLNDWKGF